MTGPVTRRLAAAVASAGVLAGGLLGTPSAEAASVPATATTKVSIRATAAADAPVLGTLEAGQRIPTAGKPAKGWVKVRFRKAAAFVPAAQVNLSGTKLPPAPRKLAARGTRVATAALKVRSGPRLKTALVGTIAEGATVQLTGRVSGGYAQTRFAGKLRWVSVRYLATVTPPAPDAAGAAALAFATAQLGKPYKYGAAGPAQYDCSGLTSAAWKAAGVTLPRTSQQQFGFGRTVALADLRPGDLVFFYGPKPSHVALYVGDGLVIHAPRPGKNVEYIKLAYMPFAGAKRPV